MADNTSTFMELTASIVSAYVRYNSVPSAELPALIGQVHTAVTRVSSGHGEALANALRPAISIKKSIAPDYIVCLEDGKKFKSLKRHLRTHYNLTPEQYREKWSLGSDYPMVAPNYAAARSRVIFGSGCGVGPQAHVLRNHKVGRMCSGAASGPRLCAVIRIARSSGSALAYSMKMSK
jgi:predicted transcriptional regulator